MDHRRIHNNKSLKFLRKKLRRNLTPAEAFLWKFLKSKQLNGRRFVKQHSIGKYVVDFYCASEQLIVELDGQVHMNATANEYDQKRTEYLEDLGYRVIRFENKMVFEHLESVLYEINSNFKN